MGEGILERVRRKVVLLDGAMGTALMARGLPSGVPGEEWNLEHPEKVRAVHEEYLAAGSDVVQTNTFGGNPLRLAQHGLADRFEAINRTAARLAREAAGTEHLVAGNLGPTGLMLPPVGDGDPEAFEAAFAAQAELLARAGVDYLSIETMIDLEEALCAIRGAKRGAPGLPVSACMVFEKKPRGFYSPMGNRPEASMEALVEAGAILVGANCSMGSAEMLELTPVLVEAASVPVVVKPNAGLPRAEGGRVSYDQAPEAFANQVAAMADAGARAVGGCCGTDGRFIAALRRALRAREGRGS